MTKLLTVVLLPVENDAILLSIHVEKLGLTIDNYEKKTRKMTFEDLDAPSGQDFGSLIVSLRLALIV